MLKRLGAYPRQNGLALALREIGRIERTLFTLDWLENPELRRQATAELNKGEARNALVVRAADVLIAVGGAYGTLSEIALALKAGKRVVGLRSWDIHGVEPAGSPEEAVASALPEEH